MQIESPALEGDGRGAFDRVSVSREVIGAVSAWALAVVVVSTVHLDHPTIRQGALFIHLVSLAVGFGGVTTVDLHGVLWMLGRRTAGELAALVTATHGLIAAGVVGLLASGAVLHPDLGTTPARLKLILVLVIVVNGVYARRFAARLRAIPDHLRGDAIPWEYLPTAFATAAISQVAWWGAIVIGFLTSASRP
jgi:hypothetical protein